MNLKEKKYLKIICFLIALVIIFNPADVFASNNVIFNKSENIQLKKDVTLINRNNEYHQEQITEGGGGNTSTPNAGDDFICNDIGVKKAMRILGYVIEVCKWIAPLLIIIFGMIDYGKAVVSNDEQALKKATGALVRRFIAGVSIFLVPTLIVAILNITIDTDINGKEGKTTIGDTNFGICTKCLFDPGNCIDNTSDD